jgi:hypothetical protein
VSAELGAQLCQREPLLIILYRAFEDTKAFFGLLLNAGELLDVLVGVRRVGIE